MALHCNSGLAFKGKKYYFVSQNFDISVERVSKTYIKMYMSFFNTATGSEAA
jgi:hypothetical protein